MQLTCVYFRRPAPWLGPALGLALALGPLRAQTAPSSAVSSGTGAATTLPTITVVGQLDQAREEIVPSLGATVYTIDQQEIQNLTQGDNVPISKLALRFPGVSQDSEGSGNFHVRDDHGNVQYRINDVLIPEGITGFSNDFDVRFADHVDLITGALPAQYGFRTTAILDIHTKDGALQPGGDVEMYGGSNGEMRPSFEYGGAQGKLSYYFSGSYLQDDLGIENPTSSTSAKHDDTNQYRGFAYLSYLIDDTSRISLIAGEAYNQFEIPNTPGLAPGTDAAGTTFGSAIGVGSFDSAQLNERQREQNNYEVLACQKTVDDLDFQLALFNRYSQVHFSPDAIGDLYFNGVAGQLDRSIMSNGLEFDASYKINDQHTLRGGLLLNAQAATQRADTTVLSVDDAGALVPGAPPTTFHDRSYDTAYSYGLYLQDEWKITRNLTLNFGGRFDLYQNNHIHENQISPRINLVYQPDRDTVLHAGYASYFTPPPLENIPESDVSEFNGTTNAGGTDAAGHLLPNDPVRAERDDYFDIGVTHNFTPEYQVGLDAYYKQAVNLVDDGQFGAAPILSAFNYARGQLCGVELSQSYTTKSGFSVYANFAVEEGLGERVTSAQAALFSGDDDAYIANHYIYLDHNQSFTGSLGVTYDVTQTETRPYFEMVCGSGLRSDTDSAPNGGSVPAYDTINLGFTQGFKWAGCPNLSARFDVANLFDQVYYLRDGSGVGVGAAQYGQRRSFFGGLTYTF